MMNCVFFVLQSPVDTKRRGRKDKLRSVASSHHHRAASLHSALVRNNLKTFFEKNESFKSVIG